VRQLAFTLILYILPALPSSTSFAASMRLQG
jgi:hypothetical protein